MSMRRGRLAASAAVAAPLCLLSASAIASTGATKDEAVAMVKKAVELRVNRSRFENVRL